MEFITKWFRGIRLRLLLLAFIPIALLLTVAYEGMVGAKTLGNDLEVAINEDLPITMYRGEMDAAIHSGVLWLYKTYASSNVDDRNKYLQKAEHEIERFNHAEVSYEKLHLTDKEKDLYQPIHENWPKIEGALKEGIALLKKHSSQDNEKAGALLREKLAKPLEDVDATFEKLDAYQIENMEEEQKHSAEDEKRVYRNIILFSVVGFVFSLVFSVFLANKLASTIGNITSSLAQSSQQVAAASSQIAATSNELSQSTMEQSASLEETTAALEEINAMVGRSAESADTTARTTTESKNKAEQGREAMDQMLTSIDDIVHSNDAIKNQIQESNQQMAEIVKVILEIGNKTKIINDIVFQTKLLSFNASVEAARAGEQGKGFSVVAEEVGNLAQMSGNAAKEISDMLQGSITRVEGIVEDTKKKVEDLMIQSRKKVDTGSSIARQCSELLNEIVQSAGQVASLSKEISQASQEQSKGVSEISKAMSQLDAVTQQNATASEEAASAADELSGQAESLNENISKLQAIIEGASTVNTTQDAPTSPAIKKVSESTPSNNVIHLKANVAADKNPKVKSAAGENYPDWGHEGFKDV